MQSRSGWCLKDPIRCIISNVPMKVAGLFFSIDSDKWVVAPVGILGSCIFGLRRRAYGSGPADAKIGPRDKPTPLTLPKVV